MPSLQALIFDVDGTLADTERHGHRVAFNQTFAAAGLDWHWSEERYGQLVEIGGGKERILHYINHDRPQFPPPPPPQTLESWVAGLHQDKSQRYGDLLRQGHLPPRPGVQRLIQEARSAGVRLAIATTSALPNALAVLETALGAASAAWFEVIAAGDVVAQKKPAPDIYRYVLERMGLPASACMAIEDSAQGLRSAMAAGLSTVITTNGYTEHQDFTGAAWVLRDLGEPDRPCQVLQGSPLPQGYLTLGDLQGDRSQFFSP